MGKSAAVPGDEDVLAAAAALAPLTGVADHDARWLEIAKPTTWTAARTAEHIVDALTFYSGQVARRAEDRLAVLRDGRIAPPSGQLDNAVTAAHILAGLLRDLGTGRAWHPSGLADAGGWAGMAVTELLVHGHDIAVALDVDLPLPPDPCARTLARVFPWVPADRAAPEALLLAVTGRRPLDGVVHDPEWWWQSAPLTEWDGRPRRRTSLPGWR